MQNYNFHNDSNANLKVLGFNDNSYWFLRLVKIAKTQFFRYIK